MIRWKPKPKPLALDYFNIGGCPGESLYGWIARRAFADHVQLSEFELEKSQGASPLFITSWRQGRLHPFSLRRMAISQWHVGRSRGATIMGAVHGTATLYPELRFCPVCANNQFHSILYQHAAIDHCPYHRVKLLRTCGYCSRRIPATYSTALSHPFECPSCLAPLGTGQGSHAGSGQETACAFAQGMLEHLEISLEPRTQSWPSFPALITAGQEAVWARHTQFYLLGEQGAFPVNFARKEAVVPAGFDVADETRWADVYAAATSGSVQFILDHCGPRILNEVLRYVEEAFPGPPEYWLSLEPLAMALVRFLHWTGMLAMVHRLWAVSPREVLNCDLIARSRMLPILTAQANARDEALCREYDLLGLFCATLLACRRGEASSPGPILQPQRAAFASVVLKDTDGVHRVRFRVDRPVTARLIDRYRSQI